MELMDIKRIAVLGTGAMAPGIVQLCAQAGYGVSMWGRTDASLERGFNRLASNLRTFRDNGLLGEGEEQEVLSRVKGVKMLEEAVSDVEFVIESVAEDLPLKKQVFAELHRLCSAEAILATNTSGLSITAIAEATGRPEQVVVTHFWNPPQLVPLVEVVGCDRTSEGTLKVARGLVERIGGMPVVLKKEALGFIGNRLQFALLREALYIVEQGIASMEDVDTAVKMSFGRRLPVTGPIETADLGGLDVFLAVSEYLMRDLCSSPEPSPLLADAVGRGWLGAKTGKGLYVRSPEAIGELVKAREQQLIRFLKQDRDKGVD